MNTFVALQRFKHSSILNKDIFLGQNKIIVYLELPPTSLNTSADKTLSAKTKKKIWKRNLFASSLLGLAISNKCIYKDGLIYMFVWRPSLFLFFNFQNDFLKKLFLSYHIISITFHLNYNIFMKHT